MTSGPDKETPAALVPDVNIGKEIRRFLKKSHYSATWLSGRMCCDRTNVYKILARRSLDSATLFRISSFLHRDFFLVYSHAYREALSRIEKSRNLDEDLEQTAL